MERQRLEQAKKEVEEKQTKDYQKKDPPSGTSTKGNNTPSHRTSKHGDASLRAVSKTLKRPGSPINSDASGNESSRKKVKKVGQSSKLGIGTSMSRDPPSRPRSPAVSTFSSSVAMRSNGPSKTSDATKAGSGSESEGTVLNAGKKNPRLKLTSRRSPDGTPRASRAASPEGAAGVFNRMPTLDEVRKMIPQAGIGLDELLAHFKAGVPRAQLVLVIKQVAVYNKGTRTLVPKPQ